MYKRTSLLILAVYFAWQGLELEYPSPKTLAMLGKGYVLNSAFEIGYKTSECGSFLFH
jgi:hypothetical protein